VKDAVMLTRSGPSLLTLQSKLFRGLGDPSRLALLHALRSEPLTVGRLTEVTGLTQSNTSNHLACLLECGLVHRTQSGKFAVYSLSSDHVSALLDMSDVVLSDVADGIAACLRYQGKEGAN
jgi:DNA-binding transcriptional ArsR family regulator